jgi:hypothetical protein
MKKILPYLAILSPKPADDVKFCLNCNDMDNLATSKDAEDMPKIRQRFRNCEKTGNFDGDICSRFFVAEPGDNPGPLFDDD